MSYSSIKPTLKDFDSIVTQEFSEIATSNVINLPISTQECVLIWELQGRTLKQELNYNNTTWNEWNKPSGVIGDLTGLTITANGSTIVVTTTNTKLKANTNYGVIYNVVSKNNLTVLKIIQDAITFNSSIGNTVGNQKAVGTSVSNIVNNRFGFWLESTQPNGWNIKIKDIRVFELPVGSIIEADFASK